MSVAKLKAFQAEVNHLTTLMSAGGAESDSVQAGKIEYAMQLVRQTEQALGAQDVEAAWMHLTGALSFLRMASFEPAAMRAIQARIDTLL